VGSKSSGSTCRNPVVSMLLGQLVHNGLTWYHKKITQCYLHS